MVWYSHLFQNFPQFIVIHTVRGFGIVNTAEIDVFLELSCFFDDPVDIGNLISGSSAFSNSSLCFFQPSVSHDVNYHTIALISHANKVMVKNLQARLQRYVNRELPDAQAGFSKGRGTRDQSANISWIIQKARESQQNIYTRASLTTLKPLTVWITINCGKF